MLGRLARYLRFVGADTAWVRNVPDDEIVAQARAEERFLLTRDRGLARRVEASLLLESPHVEEQWKALVRRFPELPSDVRFDRCSLCNGTLVPYSPGPDDPLPEGAPKERVAAGLALFRCGGCGHVYWHGSHTADIQERLERWRREALE
jgi:uncharacterized protein